MAGLIAAPSIGEVSLVGKPTRSQSDFTAALASFHAHGESDVERSPPLVLKCQPCLFDFKDAERVLANFGSRGDSSTERITPEDVLHAAFGASWLLDSGATNNFKNRPDDYDDDQRERVNVEVAGGKKFPGSMTQFKEILFPGQQLISMGKVVLLGLWNFRWTPCSGAVLYKDGYQDVGLALQN